MNTTFTISFREVAVSIDSQRNFVVVRAANSTSTDTIAELSAGRYDIAFDPLAFNLEHVGPTNQSALFALAFQAGLRQGERRFRREWLDANGLPTDVWSDHLLVFPSRRNAGIRFAFESMPPPEYTASRAAERACRDAAQLWEANADAAEDGLSSALTASIAAGATRLRAECMGRLAVLYVMRGQLKRAEQLGIDAYHLATAGELDSKTQLHPAALALAWVYVEQCRDDEAAYWLTRASNAGIDAGRPVLGPLLDVLHARLASGAGITNAIDLLARWGAVSIPAWVREYLVVQLADLELARSRADLARAAIAQLPEPRTQRTTAALRRINVCCGSSPSLQADQLGDAGGPLSQRVEAWLAQAMFYLDQRQPVLAELAIDQALGLAGPEQMRRPFLESAPQIREVLRKRYTGTDRADWLQPPSAGARARATTGTPTPADRLTPPARSGSHEQLTLRELEVLGHLAELLPTKDIGATMFVSVNTIRSHVRNILRKLDVTNRNEAVRKAWELNLI